MKATWYEFEWPEDKRAKRVPAWARRVAVADDGRVFVPSALAGSPMTVFLCAGWDGTPAMLKGKHAYYPAEWMAREFPKTAAAIANLRRNLPVLGDAP